MKFAKFRKYAALSIILALLLPALVTATVVISYTYNTSSSSSQGAQIYLATGPNYAIASDLGLVSGASATTGTYIPATGTGATTIGINAVSGSTATDLFNVFEIVNSTKLSTGTIVTVTVTPALPSGITMYYSIGEASLANPGNALSGATTFTLPAGSTVYFSFELSTASLGTSGSFSISFTVG